MSGSFLGVCIGLVWVYAGFSVAFSGVWVLYAVLLLIWLRLRFVSLLLQGFTAVLWLMLPSGLREVLWWVFGSSGGLSSGVCLVCVV